MAFLSKTRLKASELVEQAVSFLHTKYEQTAHVFTSASPFGQLLTVISNMAELIFTYISHTAEELNIKTAQNIETIYGLAQMTGHNTYRDKISINSIVKRPDDLKIVEVKSGQGVYSGLYIITDRTFDEVESVLKSWDFITYVKSLRKYKSGGYYTFSSKDVENYLNYKFDDGSDGNQEWD